MTDFDPHWPHGHVTRDGRKARIVCMDRKGEQPIGALVAIGDNDEDIEWFNSDGRFNLFGTCQNDLINAPAPKRNIELWVNVYSGGVVDVNSSRDNADEAAASVFGVNRIACLHVTGEEGDGL